MAFSQQVSFMTYLDTTGTEYPITEFYFLYNESIKCRIYLDDGTYQDLTYGDTADYVVDKKTVIRKSTWPHGVLLIYRENEYEQNTSYKNAEVVFDREQLEKQLDYITMLIQQNKDVIDRAIISPLQDTGLMVLPVDNERYAKFITFDVLGNLVLRHLTATDIGVVSISWNPIEDRYDPGILVEYGEDLWIGVAPITGSPPDLLNPTEWKRLLIDTDAIEDAAITPDKILNQGVTLVKLNEDARGIMEWQALYTYVLGQIVNHNGIYYKCNKPTSQGDTPSDGGGDWIRWTDRTTQSITDAIIITDGRPDHVIFADSSTNPYYTITINDGYLVGDRITVAAYGGGEITVDGTGLTDQKQTDNAIQYLWSGMAWYPLGGGSSSGGGSGVSVGEVTWWPGAGSIPDGKLIADGAVVNIIDYPQLFGKVGVTWGGDGVATFGLPNIQGIFPGALGTQDINGNIKGDPTAVIGDYKEDQIQNITGDLDTSPASFTSSSGVFELQSELTDGPGPGTNTRKEKTTFNASRVARTFDSSGTPGDYTDVSRAIGQWLIQAEASAPSEVNAVVVDVQIGDVRWIPHSTINQYDKVCDGQTVAIADYPELFAMLGTTWGGDGTSTFGLPNLSGIFPGAVGTQDINGNTKGDASAVIGDYKEDQLMKHAHRLFAKTAGDVDGVNNDGWMGTNSSGSSGHGSVQSYASSLLSNISGYFDRDGDYTDVSRAIGQWVIRVSQPALFHIPDIKEYLPPFDFGDKGQPLVLGELIGDGTDSLVSSSGREPVVGNVEFIPGRSNIDGIDYYDPQLKWPGKGVYGVFDDYENVAAGDLTPTDATISQEGDWTKIEATSTAVASGKHEFPVFSNAGVISVLIRKGNTSLSIVRTDASSGICTITWGSPPTLAFTLGASDAGSIMLSDELIILRYYGNASAKSYVFFYASSETPTIGDYTYYKDWQVVDLPFPVPYTKGTHPYNRWLYGMDWALSSQWTVEGWFYNTGDLSHTGYVNIFHTAVGSIPNRWTLYFSPGERTLRLYTMLDSGGAGLVVGDPPIGWNHIKVLWESGTRFRASLNGAAYVETTSSVLETQNCNKIVALGSFGDDTGFFNSYLADWKAQAGIDDTHDHYLSDKAWYDPNKTYGKDALWSIDRHGHMTGLYDNAGRIIEEYIVGSQHITKWDTGYMTITGLDQSGDVSAIVLFAERFAAIERLDMLVSVRSTVPRFATISSASYSDITVLRWTDSGASSTASFDYFVAGRWK